jgi:hypothetical protein
MFSAKAIDYSGEGTGVRLARVTGRAIIELVVEVGRNPSIRSLEAV